MARDQQIGDVAGFGGPSSAAGDAAGSWGHRSLPDTRPAPVLPAMPCQRVSHGHRVLPMCIGRNT
eukprot:1805134-Alexandrium_andersonii.AAC.2